MITFDDLVLDTSVPDGEINPKEELLNVLKGIVIADVVQTEAVKTYLDCLGEQFGLPGMKEVTNLLAKCQEEKIANIKNAL